MEKSAIVRQSRSLGIAAIAVLCGAFLFTSCQLPTGTSSRTMFGSSAGTPVSNGAGGGTPGSGNQGSSGPSIDPATLTFNTLTSSEGFTLRTAFVVGSTIYAGSNTNGLYVSTDSGNTFTPTANRGLGANDGLWNLYVDKGTIYGATVNYNASSLTSPYTYVGLSISTNGGNDWTTKTTADGLGSDLIHAIYASGSTVYVGTDGGLSVSTDGGSSFVNRTTSDGLGADEVTSLFVNGNTIYAGTLGADAFTGGGLSISTDGGKTFTNKATANGLTDPGVWSVFASGSAVYVGSLAGGLYISQDGGNTFTLSPANGLSRPTELADAPAITQIDGVLFVSAFFSTDGGMSFASIGKNSPWGNTGIVQTLPFGNSLLLVGQAGTALYLGGP